MSIAENIAAIRAKIDAAAIAAGRDPKEIKLCAATKMNDADAVRQAIAGGVDLCGENRVQELVAKQKENAYEGAPVHFIGHLQTNKLKMVLPYVSLVQSVDSVRLLDAIDKWGAANGKVVNVLIECHVAAEESKQGFSEEELIGLLSSDVHYANVRICGIMGMATFTDDENVIRSDFQRLLDRQQTLHDWIGESPNVRPGCNELSMGMSDDYPIAVEMGSTIVRIGSMIFGERSY